MTCVKPWSNLKKRPPATSCWECGGPPPLNRHELCKPCEEAVIKRNKWSLSKELYMMIRHPLLWMYVRIIGGHI